VEVAVASDEYLACESANREWCESLQYLTRTVDLKPMDLRATMTMPENVKAIVMSGIFQPVLEVYRKDLGSLAEQL
jgi:hypothetical protein